MRKNVFGRQFKRDTNERKALFRGLVSALVLQEQISTTEQKAKAIKSHADKLVTKAKHADRLHAYSLLQPYVTAPAVKKLLDDIGPRFANRQGGYTRIIRLGRRFNDNATLVRMEWVEKAGVAPSSPVTGKKLRAGVEKAAEMKLGAGKKQQAKAKKAPMTKKATSKAKPEKKEKQKKK
jgi:large subunit ribosomal protein L17